MVEYSTCHLISIPTVQCYCVYVHLSLWEYVGSRASLKSVTYVYWAWHNKLKNAVIYLIRQTSREKCKLFSWSVRDLIMMKVPATKTVKTFIHKKTSMSMAKVGSVLRISTIVINVIFIKSNVSCNILEFYFAPKSSLNISAYKLSAFMTNKTDLNKFTFFIRRNIFLNMYIIWFQHILLCKYMYIFT